MELGRHIRHTRYISWVFPWNVWYTLSTDGATKGNPETAGFGGLIRNDAGEWVVGFDLKIRYCLAYNA